MTKKYKLQIQGGVFSVFDVFEDIVHKDITVLTHERDTKFADAVIEADPDGVLHGSVTVETNRELDDSTIVELRKQFPGISFTLAEVPNEA